MSYQALARRYRSTTFDEVVGQEPIARTLKTAIEQDRVAHAYLFVGTRGVGKTSMARIFAKALNCPDDASKETARAIMTGEDVDVIEIDAASNNSVDNARELIANAGYVPLKGPYKVYIIDEVHMLSTAAFNALLKTMEEPPAHVKFVLCTTEPDKVPATIQSRCQRFDFRAIPTAQIGEHIKGVVKAEKMKADDDLVAAIARMGAGSMRDALSLLDRVMAAAGSEKKLTLPLLERIVGLPPREQLLKLIHACGEGDAARALAVADDLLATVSIDQVLSSLVETLHQAMLLAACGADTTLSDLGDEARTALAPLLERADTAGLVHMIALCESMQRAMRSSAHQRAIFDAAIVRLAMTEKLADIGRLLSSGGAPPARAPAGRAENPVPKGQRRGAAAASR